MSMIVRLAEPADLDPAADTLAAAFLDYPWTRHVIPEADYPSRLRALQRLYLTHANRYGIVAVTTDTSGVIAILPPDAPAPSEEAMAQIVALHGDRIDRLTFSENSDRDWSLETLGVCPPSQGQGIGSALLTFALKESARRAAGFVRLETSDESNVRLYERHGFHTVDLDRLPDRPPVWTMRTSV